MTTENDQLRGHAICEVNDCRSNVNGRCDHLMHADIDYGEIYNKDDCSGYNRKPLKHFCVDLDEDQMTALLAKLKSSMSDPGEEIYNLLDSIKDDNLIAANMWFISVYYRQQVYGGPEEGGWWYHITRCEESRAFDSIDWNQPEMHNFQYLIDKYMEVLQSVFGEFTDANPMATTESIEFSLKENGYYEFGQLDGHGEGYFVAIERQPGAQHDTKKQFYC